MVDGHYFTRDKGSFSLYLPAYPADNQMIFSGDYNEETEKFGLSMTNTPFGDAFMDVSREALISLINELTKLAKEV